MEGNDREKADAELPGSDERQNTPVQIGEKESSLYWQLGQKLGACMLHLYTSKMWTDVTFRCKDHADDKADRIHAHKIVLAARSPFFQGMFFGPCAEYRKWVINLLTTEAEILDLVLRYIYSDETNLTEDTAVRVLELAHMYQMPNLVKYCADFLTSLLGVDNACDMLELALLYNQTKLRDAACAFIDNHAKQVLDSDGFLRISNDCLTYILKGDTLFENEEYLFKRAMNWAECKLSCNGGTIHGQSKRYVLCEAFFHLRVPRLEMIEFARCTKDQGYYTAQEIEDIIEYINNKSFASSLCHSVVARVPQKLIAHVPSLEELRYEQSDDVSNDSRFLEKHVKTIDCTVLVKTLKDCSIHGISLRKMIPIFYHIYWSSEYKNDNLIDVTLDCTLCIDEIGLKSEFQMKQNKLHIKLETPIRLRKKDTPYAFKFEMQYRSEHSLIYAEAHVDTSYRNHCEGTNHTETCLNRLQETMSAGYLCTSYCNSSKHVDCIDSLEVHYLPCRTINNPDAEAILLEERH